MLVPGRHDQLLTVSDDADRHRRNRPAGVLLCVLALAACGGGAQDAATQAPPGPESDRAVLAITTPPDGSTTRLRFLDADTLAPREAGSADLGEYHDAWAFSPDGGTLAVGTFARTGVRLVDAASLRIVRDIPTPIAVVGVGWLSGERVAALLQSGGVLVLDVRTGAVERRWPLAYRLGCEQRRQAATAHGMVFLVTSDRGVVSLVRVDAAGELRTVVLQRLRAPSGPHTCGAAGFAVDPAGQRAVVAAPDGPLAEVDLATLGVAYRSVAGLGRLAGRRARCPAGRVCTGRRVVEWPVPGTVVLAGIATVDGAGRRPADTPAGAALVEAATWSARRIDRRAGDVVMAGDAVLSFGARRRGIRATTLGGRRRWSALPRARVREAAVSGRRAYLLDDPPRRTRVLDTRTGRVVSDRRMALGRLDVLTGRTDAGDASGGR